MSQQKVRRIVLTVSVAAITAVGAWYGAGLKTQQEYKKDKKAVLEATSEERIAQLEAARARLVSDRSTLERKIASVVAQRKGGGSAGQ